MYLVTCFLVSSLSLSLSLFRSLLNALKIARPRLHGENYQRLGEKTGDAERLKHTASGPASADVIIRERERERFPP